MHEFSGYVLRAAARGGIGARIAHSHNGTPRNGSQAKGVIRASYQARLRNWVHRYATHGLACSQVAAESLFGAAWESDPRWRILHYGVDLEPFKQQPNRAQLLRNLNIDPKCRVIGHAGRFVPQKNHAFLVEIAAACLRRAPDTVFLLAGDGPLRSRMEQKAQQLGVSSQLRFLGPRGDIPQLMLAAMDLFILPSFWEGLPVVVLETQAAGLGGILSDKVSDECCVTGSQIERLELDSGPEVWAERILSRLGEPRFNQADCQQRLAAAGMTIDASAEQLQRCYVAAVTERALS